MRVLLSSFVSLHARRRPPSRIGSPSASCRTVGTTTTVSPLVPRRESDTQRSGVDNRSDDSFGLPAPLPMLAVSGASVAPERCVPPLARTAAVPSPTRRPEDPGGGGGPLEATERASLLRYAAMSPTPVPLRQIIFDDGGGGGGNEEGQGEGEGDEWYDDDLQEAAAFLSNEFPIRCAERALMIESLPGWEDCSELREAHGRHVRAFSAVRRCANTLPHMRSDCGDDDGIRSKWMNVSDGRGLAEFGSAVRTVVKEDRDIVPLMAGAMRRLSRTHPETYTETFVNAFLDEFLLNRVGTGVLLRQYLARAESCSPHSSMSSPSSLSRSGYVVDPYCDVGAVCRLAARDAHDICRRETGLRPKINLEVHCTTGGERGSQEDGRVLKFAYIPDALAYILRELLKNSMRATTDVVACHGSHPSELLRRPIEVVASGDERRVIISVSDRAGGIPLEVGKRAFSYLYTTQRIKEGEGGSELAGHGVGLPLSRLFARYLGGDLNVISLPGYGTRAYIFLPRLESDQVEVVPDKDYDWRVGDTMGNFVL